MFKADIMSFGSSYQDVHERRFYDPLIEVATRFAYEFFEHVLASRTIGET